MQLTPRVWAEPNAPEREVGAVRTDHHLQELKALYTTITLLRAVTIIIVPCIRGAIAHHNYHNATIITTISTITTIISTITTILIVTPNNALLHVFCVAKNSN